MANDFSQDARIIEFWRFENNLTAGKAGNDLTQQNNPTYNSAAPLEGTYSLDLESTSTQMAYRTDANLSAGFPLKSGDAVKKISVAFWMRPENVSTVGYVFAKFNTTTGNRTLRFGKDSKSFYIEIGYNSGASGEGWTVVTNLFESGRDYHIGLAIDGVNKTVTVRIWDAYNSTATTYTHTFTNEMFVGVADLNIGRTSSGSYYDGLLDELVIANALLTTDEFDKIRLGTFRSAQTYDLTTTCEAVSATNSPSLAVIRPLTTTCPALSGNYITYGDGGCYGDGRSYGQCPAAPLLTLLYALETTCAAESATSSPGLAVLRKLVTACASVSSTSEPSLLALRKLVTACAAVSITAGPSLPVLRNLVTACAGQISTTSPNLKITRILQTAMAAISSATGPILKIVRDLICSLTAISESSSPNLDGIGQIYDLVTTCQVVSESGSPGLDIVRRLVTACNSASASSTPTLNILRKLVALASAISATSSPQAKIYRDLTLDIQAESVTATPGLPVLRLLAAVGTVLSQTSTPALVLPWQTTCEAVSQTASPSLVIVRSLMVALMGTSTTQSSVLRVLRNLLTTLMGISYTPDCNLSYYILPDEYIRQMKVVLADMPFEDLTLGLTLLPDRTIDVELESDLVPLWLVDSEMDLKLNENPFDLAIGQS